MDDICGMINDGREEYLGCKDVAMKRQWNKKNLKEQGRKNKLGS